MESKTKARMEPWQPHPGQKEFLDCPAKIRVLACGRRWGKTEACAASILRELKQKEPTRHLIIAPTLDQARILFDRVVALLKSETSTRKRPAADSSIRTWANPYPRLTFGPHTVAARSGHLGRTLRGNEATHVIIDEAAYVPESLVAEVAMPMLATNHGRLTLISTPNGLNHFWKFFKMGETGEHGVWSRTAPSSESPLVSKEFLRIQKEIISRRAFEIEYEARFVDAAGQVFGVEAIEACIVPEVFRSESRVWVGVDWGRYEDFTAVVAVEGNRTACQVLAVEQFRRESWPEMVERVAEVIERFPGAKVLGDGTGAGDVVTDMLKTRLSKNKVDNLTFSNLRKQELIESLRALIERQALTFEPDPELIRQLKHFEASISSSGRQRLNARSGYHDDLVIALALACRMLPGGRSAPIHLGGVRRFNRRASHRTQLCFNDLNWAQPKQEK